MPTESESLRLAMAVTLSKHDEVGAMAIAFAMGAELKVDRYRGKCRSPINLLDVLHRCD